MKFAMSRFGHAGGAYGGSETEKGKAALQMWARPFSPESLRQQLAADGGRRAYLAVGLGHAHCLAGRATVVGVVLGVARNRFPIVCAEMVNLAHQLP